MYMYSHQEYSDRYLQVANLTGSMELSILRLCRMPSMDFTIYRKG